MSNTSAQTEYEEYFNCLNEEGKRQWRKYPREYCKYLVTKAWSLRPEMEYFMTDTEVSEVIPSTSAQTSGPRVTVHSSPVPYEASGPKVLVCSLPAPYESANLSYYCKFRT
ncbi:hypothetical protein DSO57_1010340 [Entomophthora muscae]|uniref:Uncharacterized protein n=1 Tax=Entomophthora muscae TaxID=34485 RepID=A0ACC2UFZ5_9FUNG|nr:hypothetical protein DSO57_1010340 [Entomophthora muscae]